MNFQLRLLCSRSADTCKRHIKFTSVKNGYLLEGHVIKKLTLPLDVRNPCRSQCVLESRCVSINIGAPINDKVICELSDSDHSLHPEHLKPRAGFTFISTENACSSSPCFHNGTCLNGFTVKGYLCICPRYFNGENCKLDPPGTCKELLENNLPEGNKAYPLKLASTTIPVYCHVTDDLGSCGCGGWTLVMKINGSKVALENSNYRFLTFYFHEAFGEIFI
ncbi:uncharacterized protein LOC110055277 [Orbicella faveolata]|uniref:uncharacterized protein LOC110055277 n=1 Tax=Orbicella faveolata TaxID=48498 RepID=UPI0009E50820|nr:uncharacterized protein LOC110055277 [Orbicella faveolata]